jgi:hypothetical protein
MESMSFKDEGKTIIMANHNKEDIETLRDKVEDFSYFLQTLATKAGYLVC